MIAFVLAWVFLASGAHPHHAPAKGMRTPTVAFDEQSRLWRVWTDEGHVLVSVSTDRGASWRAPMRVTRQPETIDANGESRPKIAIGPRGEVYVSWTRSGSKPYTGDIRFSRSLDGGKTFSAPRTINDDAVETGHRFDALSVGPDGTVHIAWIDKRDRDRAEAAKQPYEGAALYHTFSRDRGATFAANRKVKDNVCECCRVASSFDSDGSLIYVWRDIIGESIRDHAMVRLSPNGTVGRVQRATSDGWKINGCPHHGPHVATASNGVMHVVWYTGVGPEGGGTFYQRLNRDGSRLGAPRRLTPAIKAHAVVHVRGSRVILAWKQNNVGSDGSSLVVAVSNDGGATFGPERTVAATSGTSDHPLLVADGGGAVYASWFAANEGHRLFRIEG